MASTATGGATLDLDHHTGQQRRGGLILAPSNGGSNGGRSGAGSSGSHGGGHGGRYGSSSMQAAAFHSDKSASQPLEPMVPTAEFEAAIAAASSAAEESLAATRSQLEALHAEVRKRSMDHMFDRSINQDCV